MVINIVIVVTCVVMVVGILVVYAEKVYKCARAMINLMSCCDLVYMKHDEGDDMSN